LFHASGGSGALTFKPVTAGTSRSILQVWGTAPDDLWIVSEDFVGHATAETIGSAQPFAPVAVPSSYTDSVVFVKPTAVWGTANETWFAGTESSFCAPPDCVNETRTFVARRSVANDGAVSWSPLALPAYPGSLGIVAGVTVADGSQYVAINSDEVWTESWVAHVATDASLLDPDGGPIVPRFSRPTALWGTSSDDLWLLGASGVVRHFDGKEWQLVRVARTNLSPVAEDLRGIAATTDESGEREMWIVGDDIAMHRTVKP
jgi:hypothetical protein